MQTNPQVLVNFKSGEQVVFDVSDHAGFVRLVEEVAKLWGNWLFIGQTAAVRKKDVASLYYFPEGYASHKNYKA